MKEKKKNKREEFQMRKFTKAAAMLCAAAMVIPSASVFAAEDGGASELT